jgi:hypothetical protein
MPSSANACWRNKLSLEAEVSDHERALYGMAHLAVRGDTKGTILDQSISDQGFSVAEHTMAELEAPAADPPPAAGQAVVLWRESITAPLA